MSLTNNTKPVRKAILICSPGSEEINYLYSAPTDIDNVKNLLLSPRGGRWKESEIIVLLSPDVATLKSTIERSAVDYLFVYYAGHGYETPHSERRICLPDSDLSDIFLLNASPRQLVILDSCREKEYPAISGIPEEEEKWLHDGYYPEREAFDNYILQSKPGKIIIHATKSGFASWEDKSGDGGVFTNSLILAAGRIQKDEIYFPISIEEVLKNAKKIIKQSGDYQEPEIVHSEGNMTVPFVLSMNDAAKQTDKNIYISPFPRKVKKESTTSGLLKAGLLILAIAIIADSSD